MQNDESLVSVRPWPILIPEKRVVRMSGLWLMRNDAAKADGVARNVVGDRKAGAGREP